MGHYVCVCACACVCTTPCISPRFCMGDALCARPPLLTPPPFEPLAFVPPLQLPGEEEDELLLRGRAGEGARQGCCEKGGAKRFKLCNCVTV